MASRDGRWRIEQHTTGDRTAIEVREHGALVLRTDSRRRLEQFLAVRGVDLAELQPRTG